MRLLSHSTSTEKLHVLVVNIPLFGHVTPLLELARKISKFHFVTFALSSYMADELEKRELIRDSDEIEIYRIKDDVVDSLQNEDLEDGMGGFMERFLPAVGHLFQTIPIGAEPQSLDADFRHVDVVVADMLLGRELPVCSGRGVPYYVFNAASAMQTYYYLCIDEDVPTILDSEVDAFDPTPGRDQPRVPLGKNWKIIAQDISKSIPHAAGIIVNSFRDAEQEVLSDIQQSPGMSNVPVYCVGPLLPAAGKDSHRSSHLVTERAVLDWLDRKQTDSVVYVSFGSIAFLSPEQNQVLFLALRDIGRPFILSLPDKDSTNLPSDLIAQFRSLESNHLVLNWAPQKLILEHPAVAVFLSHCGWNSTLESLSYGKPIVCWPLLFDQRFNAEWIVKLGAGLMIPDTSIKCDPVISAQEIQEAVETVARWNNGKKSSYRKEARSWRVQIGATWDEDGTSYAEFLDLMKFQSN